MAVSWKGRWKEGAEGEGVERRTWKRGGGQRMVVSRLELTEEVVGRTMVETVERTRERNPGMGALHVVENEPTSTRSLLGVESIDVGEEVYLQPPAPFERKKGKREARQWFQGTCEPCVGRNELRRARKRQPTQTSGTPSNDATAESLEEIWNESVADYGCYEIVQIETLFRKDEVNTDWELGNLARKAPTSLASELPGITSPQLHRTISTSRGGWKVNDADLHSVHFLHHQSQPRVWFMVHECYGDEFLYLARKLFPELFKHCPHFLQHGDIFISPRVIKEAGINVELLVQSDGEFVIIAPKTHYAYFDFGPTLCETVSFAPQPWNPSPESPAFCRCGHRPMWEKGYKGFSDLFNVGLRTPTSILHWSRSSFSLKDSNIPVKGLVPAEPCPSVEVEAQEQEKESPVAKRLKSGSRSQRSKDVCEVLAISLEENSSADVDMSEVGTRSKSPGKKNPEVGDFAAVVGRDPQSGASYFYLGQILKITGKNMVTLVWFRKGSDGLFRKENREKWEEHVQSLIPATLTWVSRKKNCKGGTGGHRLISPSAKQLLGAKFLRQQPRDAL